jgi:hypothetical protein
LMEHVNVLEVLMGGTSAVAASPPPYVTLAALTSAPGCDDGDGYTGLGLVRQMVPLSVSASEYAVQPVKLPAPFMVTTESPSREHDSLV